MKAKTFLLIALSCLLVVGCKKSEEKNDPTPPEPTFTKITEDQLKSYFPYAVDDQIIFRTEYASIYDLTFMVKDFSFSNNAGKMNVAVSLKGSDRYSTDPEAISIDLKAEVTDGKILKIDFEHLCKNNPSSLITGTYSYDASKNDSLPEKIVLSNGAIIKQNIGLAYYEDHLSYKWYFLKRK